MKLKWLQRFHWQTILAGILAGGILHIWYTFSIPFTSSTSAYAKLAPMLPKNELVIVPATTAAAQILPFMTPDARYAFCHFDISRGLVRIEATLLNASWTLALYTPQGDNFHVASGLASQKLDIAFNLVPPREKFLGIFSTSSKATSDGSKVPVPGKTGLLIIRAHLTGRAYADEVNATLKQATCQAINL